MNVSTCLKKNKYEAQLVHNTATKGKSPQSRMRPLKWAIRCNCNAKENKNKYTGHQASKKREERNIHAKSVIKIVYSNKQKSIYELSKEDIQLLMCFNK